IFLGALAFSFFAKAFSGSYMKSMMTQIERRFEISSSVVGLIDGSFEIGELRKGLTFQSHNLAFVLQLQLQKYRCFLGQFVYKCFSLCLSHSPSLHCCRKFPQHNCSW
ncbi:hypothetical protein Chor_009807, partial [Crotalus horridus]